MKEKSVPQKGEIAVRFDNGNIEFKTVVEFYLWLNCKNSKEVWVAYNHAKKVLAWSFEGSIVEMPEEIYRLLE